MRTRSQSIRAAFTISQMLMALVVIGIIAAILNCFFESRRQALNDARGQGVMRYLAEEHLKALIGQNDVRNKLMETTRRVAEEYPELRSLSMYADTLEGK